MQQNLIVISLFVLFTGCTTTPPGIPAFPLQEKKKDDDGYYKYSTFWFNGKLKNGVPDGKGQCRTKYMTGVYTTEWLKGACEFRLGERIDRLDQNRSEASMAFTNQKRAKELKEEREKQDEYERAEAEERRERARSRAAAEQQLAASITGMNQQMIQDYQRMSGMVQKASTPPVRSYSSTSVTRSSASSTTKPSPAKNSSSSTTTASNTRSSNSKQSTTLNNDQNVKKTTQSKLDKTQALKSDDVQKQKLQEQAEKKHQQQVAAEEKQRELQLAKEKREADRKAEKERKEREQLAQKQREEQEKNNYLMNVKNSLRLKAVSCYGNNFAVGQIPKGLGFSKHVSGINVHYQASCPGGGRYNGVSRNFIGMTTGCFGGDTNPNEGAEIPKDVLTCEAKDMTVEVTDVRPTR
ncbi:MULTISPECIES: cell envelope integrity protein TolA [Acinetobacter]|uniref:Uncharacterized protein n=1 Tax=Acinetobacter wuhouensis TaxID=1879050 RepID=A0A4Q7ALS8_9GAMM|nr:MULTISPECIES: cell envelope integrity protein TolA [Acinetobacter]RZG45091.1 hypothetical protein EXU28_12440 [Acinetobacter wuhouensis]RZG72581.1 hypothetical protein EXU29_10185 [Acinetobacter wuhouensis]RZG76230.1 hypothetical protein EXE09_08235 [Acinetobacter sp. WCHAc060025]